MQCSQNDLNNSENQPFLLLLRLNNRAAVQSQTLYIRNKVKCPVAADRKRDSCFPSSFRRLTDHMLLSVVRWSMRFTVCCAMWTLLELPSELMRFYRSWGTSPPWPWSTLMRRLFQSWRRSCQGQTCPDASSALLLVSGHVFLLSPNVRGQRRYEG